MASQTEICNRALQHVGASRILSIQDNSKEARECAVVYEPVRRALLRQHRWNFALARTVLAPDEEAPEFGYKYRFNLPADCLRPLMTPGDWVKEGKKILTNEGEGVLRLRYVRDVTNPNEFDAMFAELFALTMAVNICEPLTQSNQKQQLLFGKLREYRNDCLAADAMERLPVDPVDDEWWKVRL